MCRPIKAAIHCLSLENRYAAGYILNPETNLHFFRQKAVQSQLFLTPSGDFFSDCSIVQASQSLIRRYRALEVIARELRFQRECILQPETNCPLCRREPAQSCVFSSPSGKFFSDRSIRAASALRVRKCLSPRMVTMRKSSSPPIFGCAASVA